MICVIKISKFLKWLSIGKNKEQVSILPIVSDKNYFAHDLA